MDKREFLEFCAVRGMAPNAALAAWNLWSKELAGLTAQQFDEALAQLCRADSVAEFLEGRDVE